MWVWLKWSVMWVWLKWSVMWVWLKVVSDVGVA